MHPEAMTPQARALLPSLVRTLARHRFVLAGGTSLALHLGHRLSVDLDFFLEDDVSPDLLIGELRGVQLSPEVLQLAPGTLSVVIGGVKVSFFQYPYPFVDPFESYEGLAVASILDVAAMKLVAVAQRSARRDFVDLYVILQQTPFPAVAARAVRRYGPSLVEPVVIGKGLTWFDDADGEPDPQYLGQPLRWDDVKAFFASSFRQFVLDLDAALGSAGNSSLK
ncbi:nucleotidyl transferase AbiEii/AbiGii toxin family protein [bacterium]|nr:nucleotidyl transferase AbiEii/AbiGii toxin family protein [bacterium]